MDERERSSAQLIGSHVRMIGSHVRRDAAVLGLGNQRDQAAYIRDNFKV